MSDMLDADTLKKYAHNFQSYAKEKGMHPIEFVGKKYLSVLDGLGSDYITSADLMDKLRQSIESESKTKIFCGTEVYDYITALNILGGKADNNLSFDFDIILEEIRKNESYFNEIKELAKEIVDKQKSITIDMDFSKMKKCADDAFIYP